MAESWRNRKTLILSWSDMVGLLTPAEYVDRVEHAYRMHGLGRVYMEPKGHIVLEQYKGEWEVMPSYIEELGADAVVVRTYRGARIAYPQPRERDCTVPYDAIYFAGEPPDDDREGSRP